MSRAQGKFEVEQRRARVAEMYLNGLKWIAGHIINGITEKLATLATVAPQREDVVLDADDYTLSGIDDVLQQLGWGS